jgi:hypothetical protein
VTSEPSRSPPGRFSDLKSRDCGEYSMRVLPGENFAKSSTPGRAVSRIAVPPDDGACDIVGHARPDARSEALWEIRLCTSN